MNKLNSIPILVTTAAIANSLTVILYFYAVHEPGGSGMTMAFTVIWMPALWLISIIITLIVAITSQKVLFKRAILPRSLPVLLFCTPVPFLAVVSILLYKDSYNAETDYMKRDGYTLKHEEWVYNSGKLAANKYYRLIYEGQDTGDDSRLPKDSVWTYFNKSGDTIKLERYNNGRLLSTSLKSARK